MTTTAHAAMTTTRPPLAGARAGVLTALALALSVGCDASGRDSSRPTSAPGDADAAAVSVAPAKVAAPRVIRREQEDTPYRDAKDTVVAEGTKDTTVAGDTEDTPDAGDTAEANDATRANDPARARVHADLDPHNDDLIGPPPPLPDCEERLAAAGVTFKPARIGVSRKHAGVYTCGSKQVVRVRRGPGEIKYSSAPLLTCAMALALADFERVAQEEAQRVLGSRITKIDHLGTYNCRKMVNYDLISEHSYANGIDLRRFHLATGKTVTVLEHFRPGEPADAPETRFLRALANRLYDEGVFSVVVTPYFDRLHRNHIHVDLARYRVDGSRP